MQSARIKRGGAPESIPLSGVGRPLTAHGGLPYVDDELLRHLQQTFKVSVAEHYTLRDYDLMVGQQQVIAHLRTLWEAQQNKDE